MAEPQIQGSAYDEAMNDLANKFARELKIALLMPYKFAPGFSGKGKVFGTSPKVATGGLLDSINVQYDASNSSFTVEMLDYWQYVNDGRKPGKYVPIDALTKWIKAKGLKGRNKKTGRFITTESFAWGISTNIKKFGIAPTYFYDKAVAAFTPVFEEEVYKALGIDLETFFDRVFEQNAD
jgi:hypothetical protein